MTGLALGLVLSAAVLHASWNALVKGASDRAVAIAAVSSVHIAGGALLVAMFGMPDPAAWPYLIASTIIHYGYYLFLVFAYRVGDLSLVYPISRGISPVLVAVGGQLWAGDELSTFAWSGIVVISLAIAVLALPAGPRHAGKGVVVAAILTGLLIASYSICDGIGVRVSNNPMSYIGWLFVLEAPVVALVLYLRRANLGRATLRAYSIGLIGGLLSAIAYGLVLYTKTFAPLGAVSAVRESSVIIAALIGAVLFGERPWQRRVGAAAMVAAGVTLLSVYS